MNLVGIPMIALYVVCMFFHPWKSSGWDWTHVHAVWDDWQTLNAAMLAFVASLIALNISRIKDEKQRERDFSASRAFLPAAFSELTGYFSECAHFLDTAWNSGTQNIAAPPPAQAYREVFRDCIRHATPEVGAYLASILVELQIHESRLHELENRQHRVSDRYSLLSYMLALGKLKVLVDRQYEFARGRDSFNPLPAVFEDFRNAYSIMNLHVEDYQASATFTLRGVTERHVARANGTVSGALSPIGAWLRTMKRATRAMLSRFGIRPRTL